MIAYDYFSSRLRRIYIRRDTSTLCDLSQTSSTSSRVSYAPTCRCSLNWAMCSRDTQRHAVHTAQSYIAAVRRASDVTAPTLEDRKHKRDRNLSVVVKLLVCNEYVMSVRTYDAGLPPSRVSITVDNYPLLSGSHLSNLFSYSPLPTSAIPLSKRMT